LKSSQVLRGGGGNPILCQNLFRFLNLMLSLNSTSVWACGAKKEEKRRCCYKPCNVFLELVN
jgi:hypothetical protein